MLLSNNKMPLKKKKVLLFLKLPPPLTGATLINQYVSESKLLKENFDIQTIRISYKNKIETIEYPDNIM